MLAGWNNTLLQRNATFRNYLAASTISLIGSCIFDIAMPLYVLGRTNSVMALSMVAVCLQLPHFLMAPLTGFSADNFSKRGVMVFSDVGQVICMIYLLAYDLTAKTPIWPVLVVVFVAKSLMLMFETVSTFQLIPALVTPEDLPEANTWFLSFHRVIQIIGPFLAGFLLTLLGVRSCIIANTLSFAATLYFTYRMRDLDRIVDGHRNPALLPKPTPANIMRSFTESLRYVWNAPMFRPFIFFMFLWNLSSLTLNSPTLTYYFTKTHQYSASQYGSMISLFGVFGIVGFVASGAIYRAHSFRATFAGACFLQALLGMLAVFAAPFPMAMGILYATSRLAGSVLSMGTFYIRQTKIPKHQIGGVNACLRMFFMSAAPISALWQGVVIEHFGVMTSMVLGSICLWGAYHFSRDVGTEYALAEAEERAA